MKKLLSSLVVLAFTVSFAISHASVTVLPEDAKDHFDMGRTHAKYKEYDKAIEEFKKSNEIFPYFLTNYNIALVYMDKNENEKALVYFEKVAVEKPHDMELNFNYAMALFELKRYEEALPKFEEVSKANPSNFEFAYNLGLTLLELGKYKEALPNFEKILKEYPKDEAIQKLVEKTKKAMAKK